jgi:ABC-2 type transport system permease protein
MRVGVTTRVLALVRKDAAELMRNPGALVPAASMAVASLIPAFLVGIVVPRLAGETLAESDEFSEAARLAVSIVPELAALDGNALVQGFVFHQFGLLILMVPVVGSMALAAHAVIGEKLARTLEPLLATPMSAGELLAAKTITPLAFSLALLWLTLAVFIVGIAGVGEPGVWLSLLGPRTLLLFFVVGPLLTLVALMLAVIISSRVNDPRSAQQLGALVVLPITAAFVGQLVGQFLVGFRALGLAGVALAVLAACLLWVGIHVFDRERILMRWK